MKTKPIRNEQTPFWRARRHALRAMARGDLDGAIRWTMVMRYQLGIVRKLNDLADNRLRPKPKPPKPEPTPAPAPAPRLPVMLDPDGFSPSGIPNRHLNTERLTRAGLDGTMAARLWASQQKDRRV